MTGVYIRQPRALRGYHIILVRRQYNTSQEPTLLTDVHVSQAMDLGGSVAPTTLTRALRGYHTI